LFTQEDSKSGMDIFDPYMDPTGRFSVEPVIQYGQEFMDKWTQRLSEFHKVCEIADGPNNGTSQYKQYIVLYKHGEDDFSYAYGGSSMRGPVKDIIEEMSESGLLDIKFSALLEHPLDNIHEQETAETEDNSKTIEALAQSNSVLKQEL
jgi:hypothetical protein